MKDGYSVYFFGCGGNKVLWEVVDHHVVEKVNYHDEIGLRGFDYNFFMKTRMGLVEKV